MTAGFLSVIIPSVGRPDVLDATLDSILRQSAPPDEIIVCVPDRADVLDRSAMRQSVQVLVGPRGSPHQRNYALRHLDPAAEIVSFFDDDVELEADYLANARRFFACTPDVVLFWGKPLADGVKIGGISRSAARAVVEQVGDITHEFDRTHAAYGCNMNVRRWAVDRTRFDEKLPLYAWLEDRDFGARCARLGQTGKYNGCSFVHLGDSGGRVSGLRLGYSQIINPVFLWRKGSMRMIECLWFVTRAAARNLLGVLLLDRRIDRVGRARGNLLGLLHLLRGYVNPERILQIR